MMARMATLPFSRISDPIDAPAIRWGVLAPGGIAHEWTSALHARTASRVVATGSRSLVRAQAFATEFGADRAYGSYESLVEDPEVDAIYVASLLAKIGARNRVEIAMWAYDTGRVGD